MSITIQSPTGSIPVNPITPVAGTPPTPNTFGGWIQVSDTQYTTVSPLAIAADTPVTLTNNAGSVLALHPPTGLTSADIWDSDNSTILVPELGNAWTLRITAKAKTALEGRAIRVELDIGGTQGVIDSSKTTNVDGADVWELLKWELAYYQLGTFQANGGTLTIESNGAIELADISFVFFEKGHP